MSLRKSPTLTPALLAACRHNAKKSTGPRTPRGKANVRLNALGDGEQSKLWRDFAATVFEAPPGEVERTVRALLTIDLARHQKFTSFAEIAIEADLPGPERLRRIRKLFSQKKEEKKGFPIFFEQSGNVLENTGPQKSKLGVSGDVVEDSTT